MRHHRSQVRCRIGRNVGGGDADHALNVEADDLHPAHHHPLRPEGEQGGWVGIDRGLSAFVVAARADGAEVDRITDAPKALAAGLNRQRRLAKSLSRKQKGSHNRRDATAKLGRHHHHMANIRRHFLHQVARAISDASWAEFARLLKYKQTWRGGVVLEADRWYPSTRLCPVCGVVNVDMTLADRVFTCGCGHCADRDTNAAVNLARWAQTHPAKTSPDPRTPKQQGRPPTPADGTALTSTPRVPVKPAERRGN